MRASKSAGLDEAETTARERLPEVRLLVRDAVALRCAELGVDLGAVAWSVAFGAQQIVVQNPGRTLDKATAYVFAIKVRSARGSCESTVLVDDEDLEVIQAARRCTGDALR